MALKLGSLFFDIGGDTSRLKRSEKEVSRTTKRMGKSFQRLGGLIATALGFETVRRFIKIADSMTRLEGRLKVVTRGQKEYNEALEGTFRIANDIGIAVDGTIVAFQRFSLVRDVVKASNKDILNFTETIQKLGIISGSTSDEVRSTSIQIGQALTNNFSSAAQEINSINEQMPEVARTVERQLGLGFGAFKKEAIAGRITSEDFFNAILESQKQVDERFKQLPITVERAMARMGNSIKIAAKELNDELVITPKIVVMINKMSNFIRLASAGLVGFIKIIGIEFDAFSKRLSASAIDPLEKMKNAAAQTSIKFQIMWQKFEIAVSKADLKLQSLPGMRWLIGLDKTTKTGVDEAILKLSALEAVLKDLESLDPLKTAQERIAAINAEKDAKIFAIRAEMAELQILLGVKQKTDAGGDRVGGGKGGVFVDGQEVIAGPVSAIDQIIADMGNETQEILNQLRERNQKILEATENSEKQRAALIRSSREKAARDQMQLDLSIQQAELAATAGFLENLMDVLRAAGKENSALGKALFLAQQALAVAQIITSTMVGAAQALSLGPAGIPLAAIIQATGFANAGIVAGLAIGETFTGGGRRSGGPVFSGAMHPINEGGGPEVLQQGARQFLLPGSKGGRVISSADMAMGGGGVPKITVINSGDPVDVEGVSITREEVRIMIGKSKRETIEQVDSSLASGRGSTHRALHKGNRLERNING